MQIHLERRMPKKIEPAGKQCLGKCFLRLSHKSTQNTVKLWSKEPRLWPASEFGSYPIGSCFAGMQVAGVRELWLLVPRFQETAEARQCLQNWTPSKETPKGTYMKL